MQNLPAKEAACYTTGEGLKRYPTDGFVRRLCGGVIAQPSQKQLNVAFNEGCERNSARPEAQPAPDKIIAGDFACYLHLTIAHRIL